jgi:tetratricopeptide (TPR) repeat protein
MAAGDTQAACREFGPIVADDPELKRASSHLGISALTNLALGLESGGEPLKAAKVLEPARGVAANVLYNLGRLNLLAGRLAEALPSAEAAALLEPESEEVVHLAGRILLGLKRESDAEVFLRRAVGLNSTCAMAWYDLGVTLARQKRRRDARACFTKSIRLDPTHAWSYYDVACLDALQSKRDAAFRNLRRAVSHGLVDLDHMNSDPDLRGIRRDVRWKALEKAMRRATQ